MIQGVLEQSSIRLHGQSMNIQGIPEHTSLQSCTYMDSPWMSKDTVDNHTKTVDDLEL